jgi:hypothetical protein
MPALETSSMEVENQEKQTAEVHSTNNSSSVIPKKELDANLSTPLPTTPTKEVNIDISSLKPKVKAPAPSMVNDVTKLRNNLDQFDKKLKDLNKRRAKRL